MGEHRVDNFVETVIDNYRELHQRLHQAVEGLDTGALNWVPCKDANSIGVLVIHTMASEMDWLHIAAGRPFPRDRESEFRARAAHPLALHQRIDEVMTAIPDLLKTAYEEDLATRRQRERDGRVETALWCILHSVEHTAEHVGQVELTRQLLPATPQSPT